MSVIEKAHQVLWVERRLPWRIKKRINRRNLRRIVTQRVFRLVRTTPPIESTNTSPYEIVTLLDKGNVDSYLLTIKSFMLHSPMDCRITVISDGSLGMQEKKLLAKHVRNINILEPIPTYPHLPSLTDDENLVLEAVRQEYIFIKKVFDLFYSTHCEFLITIDSDVLVLNDIDPTFFELGEQAAIKYNCDHDHSQHDDFFYLAERFMREMGFDNPVTNLNSGFFILSKDCFDLELIAKYIVYVHQNAQSYYVLEQDCWNVLASAIPSAPLPDSYLVGSNFEDYQRKELRAAATSIHYVSMVRYTSFEYLSNGLKIIQKARSRSQ